MANPLSLMQTLSKFAVGQFPRGADRAAAILGTVKEHLTSLGIPGAAIERLESLGKALFRRPSGLPKSVSALAGSSENAKAIEETLGLARAAWKGSKGGEMKAQFTTILGHLERAGVSKAVVDQIRKLGPEKLAKVGAGQTMSAFERVGPDPWLIQMYNKTVGKPFTSKAHNQALQQVLGEGAEKVTTKTSEALKAAGLPAFTGSGLLRETAGAVGGYSGTGAAIGLGVPAMFTMMGREQGPSSAEGQSMAAEGFRQLAGSSSPEVLTNIVRQQELAARRALVLQTHEPQLFQQVLGALAGGGGGPATITQSERSIGRGSQHARPTRRPDNDVKFLLDQLLMEASDQ